MEGLNYADPKLVTIKQTKPKTSSGIKWVKGTRIKWTQQDLDNMKHVRHRLGMGTDTQAVREALKIARKYYKAKDKLHAKVDELMD